jgi:hypothetical protein
MAKIHRKPACGGHLSIIPRERISNHFLTHQRTSEKAICGFRTPEKKEKPGKNAGILQKPHINVRVELYESGKILIYNQISAEQPPFWEGRLL